MGGNRALRVILSLLICSQVFGDVPANHVIVDEMPAVTIPPVTIDTTGLATDTKQATQIASYGTIISNQTNGSQHVIVDSAPAVSVDTTGLATSTNQATQIASLGTTNSKLTTINSTLGSPFQAGGSIGNSSFGISGTLPAFTSTPTFNLGTIGTAATAANQATEIASLGTLSTSALQTTGNSSLSTISTNSTTQIASLGTTNSKLTTINTTLGSPFQAGGSIGNASFGVSGSLPAGSAVIGHVINDTGSTTAVTGNVTAIQATGSNLHVAVDSAPTTTVSGTVTVNQGTSNTTTQSWPMNVASFGSTAVSTGAGAGGAGIPRVTVSNDSTVGLVAGSAIVGKVGIDQTTPGTTNLVSAGQNGTWTMQPGNTPNTTAWLTTDSATQSNSVAANNKSNVSGGVFNTTPATLSNGQVGSLQMDSAQNLLSRINFALPAGTNSIGTTTVNQGNTASTTQGWLTNIASFGNTTISTGTGASGAGIPRVTISNDSSLAANQSVNTAQVNGVTTSVNKGAADTGSQRVVIASDSSINLGTSTGKTNILLSGSTTTTSTAANQVIKTYTVTSGKTFYVNWFEVDGSLNTPSATAAFLGVASLESPAGTTIASGAFMNTTTSTVDRLYFYFNEPIPISSGTVIRAVTLPAAATSTRWITNFGGYEK